MKKRLIFLLSIPFLVLLYGTAVLAQSSTQRPFLKLTNISEKVGLPGEFARCIMQDSMGFMWFGKEIGFNRFDGYEYKEYLLSHGDIWVTAMTEDYLGDIWAFAGADVMYHLVREKDLLTRHVIVEDSLQGTGQIYNKSKLSHSLFEDSKNNLWVGTYKGFRKLDREKNIFVPVGKVDEHYRGWVLETKEGQLIEVKADGIHSFNTNETFFLPFKNEQKEAILIPHLFEDVIEDQLGIIWIATGPGGLYSFNKKSGLLTHHQYDPDNPKSRSHGWALHILEKKDGSIWIASDDDGLDYYDREANSFFNFPLSSQQQEGIKGKPIFAYEDREQGLWISQYHGGVSYMGGHSKKIKTYTSSFRDKQSLSFPYVQRFFERPNGDIWITTDGGGLNLWDRKKDVFYHFMHEPDNPNSLRRNKCNQLVEDKNGLVWISSGAGIDQFDYAKNTFKFFSGGVLFLDSQKEVWKTQNGEIHKYNYESGKFKLMLSNHSGLVESPDGKYWVGTPSGLCQYDFELQKFGDCIKTNAYAIESDAKGQFWMLLPPQGDTLIGYDPFRKTFIDTLILLNSKDHMGNTLVVDDNDDVWLATNLGIFRYNPSQKVLKQYDFEDGLTSSYFRLGMPFKTKRGELLFGSPRGFNVLHPEELKENKVIPPVFINKFKIANKEIGIYRKEIEVEEDDFSLEKDILYTESITLSHLQNDFSLGYTALNYDTPSKNEFKYKLEGFDKDWIFSNANNRVAKYTNLSSGNYTFKVIGSNNDGLWNEKGDSINIKILPPWWQTWWAYCIYVLTAGGTLLWYIQNLRKKIKAKQSQLEKEQIFNHQLTALNKANSRFVPNDFLQILAKESILDLKLGDQTATKMTILFADIRDYTTISETMTPEQNFKFINAYLGRMGPIIKNHGGFICQYFGDGIMALFKNDHEEAVKAAIEMQKTLNFYNQTREEQGKEAIQVGIGLNTGQLMLGVIGDKDRYDSSVISDAVNTAARMEGLTKIFGCMLIISEPTLQELLLLDDFLSSSNLDGEQTNLLDNRKLSSNPNYAYRFLGKVKVKGKKVALNIYDFYDGDPIEIQQLKTATKVDFEKALHYYFDKDFGKAADLLKVILGKYPADKAANYYFEKALLYVTDGVSEAWSGVEEMISK